MKAIPAIVTALSALLIAGCGFTPVYSTLPAEAGGERVVRLISIAGIAAPEEVAPYIQTALNERFIPANNASPSYDLHVEVSERADRLGVQIDASVTRYNYRLLGRYRLAPRDGTPPITGGVSVVTSYNIVTSQYSTLFAERTAQEKAAQLLAIEIERDIFSTFLDKKADAERLATDPETETPSSAAPGEESEIISPVIDPETDLIDQREEELPNPFEVR